MRPLPPQFAAATPPEIELCSWPMPAPQRAALRARGALCLYIVQVADVPPDDLGTNEEWVRVDADPIEVHWRIRRLQAAGQEANAAPEFRDGCVFYRGATVVVPPSCERITALLCEQFDNVVARPLLLAGDIGDGDELSCATLNTRLHRIRHLLEPIGLRLTSVRARGYLLQAAEPAPPAASPRPPAGRRRRNATARRR